MNTLAQSSQIAAPGASADRSNPLVTLWLLRALSKFVDTHGWMVCTLVSLACGWVRLGKFGSRPLSHDELYTFYIAQAPTLSKLLALTRTVDLHPPLSYLFVRGSLEIFGVNAWSCRLPSVIAFFLAVGLVFWLIKRIFSPLYGIISVLLLWSIPFTYQADEARPYSLMLCFTALMLLGWYGAGDGSTSALNPSDRPIDRRFALLALTAGGFGLLLSHVLGALAYAAFFVAELLRFSIRRKYDWGLWAALIAPAISVFTYLPLFHTHAGILFTDEYHATPLRIFNFYWRSISLLVVPLMAIVAVAVFWPRLNRHAASGQLDAPRPLPALSLLVCLLGFLFFVPLAVGILFSHTGTAFFDRYGIVAMLPIAIFPALLLSSRTQSDQMAGLVIALLLATVFFFNTAGRVWFIEQLSAVAPSSVARYTMNVFALPTIVVSPAKSAAPLRLQKELYDARPVSNLDAVAPTLPLVANTGLTFLEIDRIADAQLAERLYLLSDPKAAAAIAHDTVFENYDRLKPVFPIRGKVEPYCAFINDHPRFLVLGAYNHPQGWLLKRLDMDGAELRIIGSYGGLTEDARLYEVNMATAKIHCGAL